MRSQSTYKKRLCSSWLAVYSSTERQLTWGGGGGGGNWFSHCFQETENYSSQSPEVIQRKSPWSCGDLHYMTTSRIPGGSWGRAGRHRTQTLLVGRQRPLLASLEGLRLWDPLKATQLVRNSVWPPSLGLCPLSSAPLEGIESLVPSTLWAILSHSVFLNLRFLTCEMEVSPGASPQKRQP